MKNLTKLYDLFASFSSRYFPVLYKWYKILGMGYSNDTLFNSLIHWVKNLCGFKIVSEFMDHPVHGKSWFDASIWIEIHVYMDMLMHANLIKITDIYLKNKNEQIKRVYVYYFVTEFVKQRQLWLAIHHSMFWI